MAKLLTLDEIVALSPVIVELRRARDMAAREAIIFDTDQGRIVARSRANTYNTVLKLLGVDDGATAELVEKSRAELKELRGW